jgi:hypothetical protein
LRYRKKIQEAINRFLNKEINFTEDKEYGLMKTENG